MATSTLTSKGQITVPRVVRERLGMKQGDRLEFALEARMAAVETARRPRRWPSSPATLVTGAYGERVILQPAAD